MITAIVLYGLALLVVYLITPEPSEEDKRDWEFWT